MAEDKPNRNMDVIPREAWAEAYGKLDRTKEVKHVTMSDDAFWDRAMMAKNGVPDYTKGPLNTDEFEKQLEAAGIKVWGTAVMPIDNPWAGSMRVMKIKTAIVECLKAYLDKPLTPEIVQAVHGTVLATLHAMDPKLFPHETGWCVKMRNEWGGWPGHYAAMEPFQAKTPEELMTALGFDYAAEQRAIAEERKIVAEQQRQMDAEMKEQAALWTKIVGPVTTEEPEKWVITDHRRNPDGSESMSMRVVGPQAADYPELMKVLGDGGRVVLDGGTIVSIDSKAVTKEGCDAIEEMYRTGWLGSMRVARTADELAELLDSPKTAIEDDADQPVVVHCPPT